MAESRMGNRDRIAQDFEGKLSELRDRLRERVEEMNDPQGDALLETSAEVLDGLVRAFRHFREESEKAWE